MSRMFRVITGPAEGNRQRNDHRDAQGDGDAPFIEVGGPEGVIMSFPTPNAVSPPTPAARGATPPSAAGPPSAPPRMAAPAPSPVRLAPEVRPPAPAPQPAAPQPAAPILSVTFHRFPKPGLRIMNGGVAPDVVAFHFPDHAVSGEYRRVTDDVLAQYDVPGPRAVVFTAAEANAGTSTVAVNLAVSLVANHGHRVLMVDANFARPGIARRLSCAESPGLADVLGQSIPLAWALQPTPLPNLHVLATGHVTDNTEEALSSDLPRLVAQLRQWFDWVVIDAGVWGELPGGDSTAATADGVYLVARDADAENADFVSLRSDIAAVGGPVRGFVTTRQ